LNERTRLTPVRDYGFGWFCSVAQLYRINGLSFTTPMAGAIEMAITLTLTGLVTMEVLP